ncbi:MAG: sigma factor-like helix-turn-helix DNA-binding protein [Patescibacteria group bacterium]|jgi:predicted Zn-ribbon and HTH transcriptional regulator|nr:sigma factor-like helix-turn-helix DNA-binding protein [Patescibacteria group bacterium]
MNPQNSILDKIIESQEKYQAAQFNPNDLVANLLKNLSTKESDILSRRFGLMGKDKETLEQIGKYYDITRERIRQIETATVKKLHDLKDLKNELSTAEQHIIHLLEKHGGIMEEYHLLDQITNTNSEKGNYESSNFILSKLLNDKIHRIKSDQDILTGWKLPLVPIDLVKKSINELVGIINSQNKLLATEDLIGTFRQSEFYVNNQDNLASLKIGSDHDRLDEEINNAVKSYLKISRHIDQNILGEWGLNKWNTVRPKRMSDKVYLVLKKAGRPLHFTEITELINQTNFDKKIAYPATIHNELILDDRYVLVGRGIYALKEWGYKPGTVMDTIVEILKNANHPMTKEEIVKAVSDQRIVRKSTIYLALTNKDKITKLPDGRYTLNQ